MAEKDLENEEYKFEEFDPMAGNETEELDAPGSSGPESSQKKDVRRNALIVMAIVIALSILYKILGALFSSKSEPVKPPAVPAITQQAAPVQPVITPAQPTENLVTKETDIEIKQKVADIEANQQSIKAEVSTVNDQVGTVNTNVNNLNAQLTKLSQAISELSNQVTKQNGEISMLMARSKPRPKRPVVRYQAFQSLNYYIQAVIPGRAWLIASNGSTLTVRVGTKIRGYGDVRLIDSIQGRVLTSSGRVIRFSQEDS